MVDHLPNNLKWKVQVSGRKFQVYSPCIPRWEDHRFQFNISWVSARASTGNWAAALEEYRRQRACVMSCKITEAKSFMPTQIYTHTSKQTNHAPLTILDKRCTGSPGLSRPHFSISAFLLMNIVTYYGFFRYSRWLEVDYGRWCTWP